MKVKDMRRSSRSWLIWMMCLLESVRARVEEEALAPRVEPTAGPWIRARM